MWTAIAWNSFAILGFIGKRASEGKYEMTLHDRDDVTVNMAAVTSQVGNQ